MLNPECVDKTSTGDAKIVFSDENSNEVLNLIIDKNEVMSLAKMIQDKFSYKAQKLKKTKF